MLAPIWMRKSAGYTPGSSLSSLSFLAHLPFLEEEQRGHLDSMLLALTTPMPRITSFILTESDLTSTLLSLCAHLTALSFTLVSLLPSSAEASMTSIELVAPSHLLLHQHALESIFGLLSFEEL